uniref:Capsid protein n=1 Tax=Aegithalos caudatus Genomoviridae sp. TaxID=2814943 RepID=A0A8A4XCU4_9VIRU
MAYRRSSTRYRAKRQTRRSAPRAKYGGRKRRWTKTRKTSRPMTKKRILNTTSRKKRNGMLSWSNTTQSGASRTLAQGPAYINNSGGFFVYSPTCQSLDGQSVIPNQATRTATTCYMRGLSEHLRIQTSSGVPWFHRRICFTLKGPSPFNQALSTDTPTQAYAPYLDTSNGIERPWLNTQINAMSNTQSNMWSLLYKGVAGKDWDDLIIAPLDTSRLSVKFDKTWTMQSGNTNGVVRERKLWHPMNKNIVYDDDESGDVEVGSYFSVDSKAGMGDYYVVDVFQPGTGATSSDLLQVSASSTLYWHEK